MELTRNRRKTQPASQRRPRASAARARPHAVTLLWSYCEARASAQLFELAAISLGRGMARSLSGASSAHAVNGMMSLVRYRGLMSPVRASLQRSLLLAARLCWRLRQRRQQDCRSHAGRARRLAGRRAGRPTTPRYPAVHDMPPPRRATCSAARSRRSSKTIWPRPATVPRCGRHGSQAGTSAGSAARDRATSQ